MYFTLLIIIFARYNYNITFIDNSNKIKIMKSTVLGLLMLASMPIIAQNKTNLPKWVSTPPHSTPTSQKIVSTGSTISEARHNAVNQLIGLTNLPKEDNSYQKRLLDEGREPISQHQALVTAAENSSFFKTIETYSQDNECYVLCEMETSNLKAFSDSLYNAITNNTFESIKKARSLRQSGDLYGAATEYSTALRGIIPMIHKQLSCDEGDLVDILHNEFVHSFDDIVLKLDRDNCPMVKGEEVPLDIMVTATYNNLPVSALPLTFKISDDGKVSEKGKTDGKGRAKTRISAAPNKDKAKLTVYTDLQSLSSTLPSNIFTMEMTQHLALEPKQANMILTAFDPTPTYYAEMDMELYPLMNDSINALMKRAGNKPSPNAETADLLIKVEYKHETEGNTTTGKYPMQYYLCDMAITLTERNSKTELAKAEKSGLRLFLRTNVTEDQVRELGITELYKRMRAALKNIQSAKFDKRKFMYSDNK